MRVLLYDIETSPCLSYMWGLYQEVQKYKFVIKDWYVMCWSAKWLGDDEIFCESLIDHKYTPGKEDDKPILKNLHRLLDQADVCIYHNGDKFDRRKVNARFIINGFPPPSPYKSIDTLKAARQNFCFTSNRLDDLGKMLGVGRKVDTNGYNLWLKCLDGDKEAWGLMKEYNKQDVLLLERIYLKLRPYMKNHPNLNLNLYGGIERCPICHSINVYKQGFAFTATGKYQRYQCNDCGKWAQGRKNLRDDVEMSGTLRSI